MFDFKNMRYDITTVRKDLIVYINLLYRNITMAKMNAEIKATKAIEDNKAMVLDKESALATRGKKISQAQIGVPKRAVTVKVDGTTYRTLCDGLKAIGYDVQNDWVRVRKNLKLSGTYVERDFHTGKGDHTFELV